MRKILNKMGGCLKRHPRIVIYICVFVFAACLIVGGINVYCSQAYNKGVAAYNTGLYEEAWNYFSKVVPYKESIDYLQKAAYAEQYEKAKKLFEGEEYIEAAQAFLEIDGYEQSRYYYQESQYRQAVQMYDNGDFDEAQKIFASLDGYSQSKMYLDKIGVASGINDVNIMYDRAKDSIKNRDYAMALKLLELSDGFEDSERLIDECKDRIFYRMMSKNIAGGLTSTIGVSRDGSAIYAGTRDYGQGDVTSWSDLEAVDTFSRVSVGLKRDGTILAVGKCDGRELDLSDWQQKNFVDVVAGEQYVIGLTEDGEVLGKGHGDNGQIDTEEWEKVVQVSAAWRTTAGLTESGEIKITGYGDAALLGAIENNKKEWDDVVSIAIGGGGPQNPGNECFIVGLKRDGTVAAASSFVRGSSDDNGQCDVYGEEWNSIVAISVGDWHTVGLKADGTVVATGHDNNSRFYNYENCCKLDEWKDIVAISAGTGYTIGIKSDGSVIAQGYSGQGQIMVDKWKINVPDR